MIDDENICARYARLKLVLPQKWQVKFAKNAKLDLEECF